MFHVPSFPLLARAAPHPALPLQIVLNDVEQTAPAAPAARSFAELWEARCRRGASGLQEERPTLLTPMQSRPELTLGRGPAVHLPRTSPPKPSTWEFIITACRGLMSLSRRLTRREKEGKSPTRSLGPCPRVTMFPKLPFSLQPEAVPLRGGGDGHGQRL